MGILTDRFLNCDIHIYYIQIESLIFARKSVSENEKRTSKKIFVSRSLAQRGRVRCRTHFELFPRVPLHDGIAHFLVAMANANEHYRDLAALKRLRSSFVLDALKNWSSEK